MISHSQRQEILGDTEGDTERYVVCIWWPVLYPLGEFSLDPYSLDQYSCYRCF